MFSNSQHKSFISIFHFLKLLRESNYKNDLDLNLDINQNVQNKLLNALKEIFSSWSEYVARWCAELDQMIISSSISSTPLIPSTSLSVKDLQNLWKFLSDGIQTLCDIIGGQIKTCSTPFHPTTAQVVQQCQFLQLIKILGIIIDWLLDFGIKNATKFSVVSRIHDNLNVLNNSDDKNTVNEINNDDIYKLIRRVVSQFVCEELIGEEILLQHHHNVDSDIKNMCTVWWIRYFYENPWNDGNNRIRWNGECLHSLTHLLEVVSIMLEILGSKIPRLNQEISRNALNEKIFKNLSILCDLLVKLDRFIIRALDEVIIPVVMVHLDLQTTNRPTKYVVINDPIILESLIMLTKLFNIPSALHVNAVDKKSDDNCWKKLYAKKLVVSGFIDIALHQKHQQSTFSQFNTFTNSIGNVSDLFLIALVRILAGFQEVTSERAVVNRQGNLIPDYAAFKILPSNLQDVLAMLASDPTKETTALKQQLDRVALAIFFVCFTCDDQMLKKSSGLSAPLVYQTLTRFITKYFSLDFLHGVSMIHFLYLYIISESECNNSSEFKPHTNSKIISSLQSTLVIQPNDVTDKSEISIIENIFFNYDSVFMPWVWKVCEGSWSLKEFVSNLFQDFKPLDISFVINGNFCFSVNPKTRNLLKIGNLLFQNSFAVQILLLIFSSLRTYNNKQNNENNDITRLFNIISSIFICIISFNRNYEINEVDNNEDIVEDKKLLFHNFAKFWTEILKLFGAPGIIENVPTDWWPTINIIVLILGYHFDPIETLIGVTNLSGVMLEIRQHPMLLEALRQWTLSSNQNIDYDVNKFIENTTSSAALATINIEVKSSIVGLLSLTIPSVEESNNVSNDCTKQEFVLFPTVNEFDDIMNMFRREPSLFVGHICSIISTGFRPLTSGEFKQKTRLIYINIWNIFRDFIVSEGMIEMSNVDSILLEMLLRMLHNLHKISLLSESQRTLLHSLFDRMDQEQFPTDKNYYSYNAFEQNFLMARPHKNYQFTVVSLSGHHTNYNNMLNNCKELIKEFANSYTGSNSD
ncbi:14703_t:CDS:10 [Dentiscutata erythropus]|uniref:14703_t:CDS:1 n=1 Tax=Dentiscutata erythropus TaxID=1348616 RepID=A0A9N9BQ47_9GLOM|nr:14703_t:CDS:10 [Dentiscutata erythropus]